MRIRVMLVLSLLLSGCSLLQPPPPAQVRVALPVEPPVATPGSLWNSNSDGMVADFKARRRGDILTVAISEAASASKQATTDTSRDSSASAGLANIFGLEKNISKINAGIDPTKLVGTNYTNAFKGSGATTRKEDLVASLSVRVVEVLANGNLRISGGKTVTVNREDQFINLTGEVRPADISAANVVDSKHILDANISYTGNGIISDKQGQGWLARTLDTIWPF